MNFCMDCRRVGDYEETCTYCQSDDIKKLKVKTPVNVIGTKIKGRVFNVKEDIINILCVGDGKSKQIREYEANRLRKIL